MNKTFLKTAIIIFLFIPFVLKAQPYPRVQTIGDAISLIGLPFNKMSDYLANKGYSFISSQNGVHTYRREFQFGTFEYNVNYKNDKVSVVMWSENIYYVRNILDELEYNGLVQQNTEKFIDFKGLRTAFTTLKNTKRNLASVIISKPNIFTVTKRK